MKLWHFFLIGSVLALAIGTYLVLGNSTADGVQPTSVASSLFEKHVVHNDPSTDASTDDNLKENLIALRKEVALLKADLADLRANMHASRQQITGNVTENQAATDPTPNTGLTPEETIAKEDEFFRKQGEALEAGFHQQTIDPAWSAKTKQLLQDALTSAKIPSKSVIGIECRASMCKVELASDENGKAPNTTQLQMKIGTELPNVMVNQFKEIDGSTTNIFYLSREEFNLPDSGSFIQ
ncbi:MAG: hypothetical protein ABL933_00580 [Methyloglobulus sp.]|nr:hypothetical protein [Methyloglobulus sp.]